MPEAVEALLILSAIAVVSLLVTHIVVSHVINVMDPLPARRKTRGGDDHSEEAEDAPSNKRSRPDRSPVIDALSTATSVGETVAGRSSQANGHRLPRLPVPRGPKGFNILSWNVLAEKYALPHYFPYVDSASLSWESRRDIIKRVVLSELPDLLGLQEVQSAPGDIDNDHMEWFAHWLTKRGYDVAYGRKLGASQAVGGPQSLLAAEWQPFQLNGIQIGNLTAWKRDLFTKEDVHVVPLACEVASACADKATAELLAGRHSQVLLVTVLRHVHTGRRLVVGNVHLVAPRSTEDHESKLVQMQQMAAGVRALAREVKSLAESSTEGRPHVVLLGDFNATPDSEVYELLSRGEVTEARMSRLVQRGLKGQHNKVKTVPFTAPSTDGLEMCSIHRTDGEEEPRWTNYTELFKGCLDYIMHEPRGLRCVAVGDLPTERTLKQEVALPNSQIPSDHLPLMCRFEFE